MDNLKRLENDSIYIIREAYNQIKSMAALWSIGKDSTVLMWLIRKAFYGDIPFPVIHIDTGYKFEEIYQFRDKYQKEWNLKLLIYRNEEAIEKGISPERGKFECCTELKTNALKQVIEKNHIKGLYLGIRRDEHGIRAKERTFSVRDSDFTWNYKQQEAELWDQYKNRISYDEHVRVHPLLNWTELDIWKYICRENIPVPKLYFAKEGKRYRSIGCKTCCSPIVSTVSTVEEMIEELKNTNISERSGRAQDKESDYMMQKLRSLGYM